LDIVRMKQRNRKKQRKNERKKIETTFNIKM
jgi:hypothetical protein